MYCVIQKVENKKTNTWGEAKELKVNITKWFTDGIEKVNYGYSYSGKFERPIKTVYKISIHKSYRENGKVHKKQWVICTIGYYGLIEYGLYDYADRTINDIKDEIGLSIDSIYEMIYKKLQPIIDEVTKEYEATEEYKTKVKHMVILKKYREAKEIFETKYGKVTYDYCYDIFGVLRNEKYLKELEASYKAQQEYKSSYYENSKSNYSNYDFSNLFASKTTTYTDKEKEYLKKIYKGGALNLHPDKTKDDGEGMKFLNKLKEEWGIK
jgi:hypothetical protein